MTITIYSKPACPQCNATVRAMDKKGLDYRKEMMSEEDLETFKARGHMSAPVVLVKDADTIVKEWAGFAPDKIASL